ncbi:hypothetical protein TFLX_02784 [Thermoflexales bacterium]|nr:hypothetical protein TFLX_02784 [Thermoflexales bacterium]
MTMIDAALTYAERGLYIFPCDEQGKEPHTTGGTNPKTGKPYRFQWGKHASNDPAKIKQWWAQWPNANIGLPCKPNGLIVIDPDSPKKPDDLDGLAQWIGLSVELNLPETVTQRTPHGGMHVIYKIPDGVVIGNRDLAPGVNVRGVKGDGGYIVVTPSRLNGSGAYQWEPGRGPDEIEIVPLPEVLVNRLVTPKRLDAAQSKQQASYTLADDITRADENLKRLARARADDYQTWIEVGLSLSSLGEAGKALWVDWARQSAKFDESVCLEKWESFKSNGAGERVTLASLTYWADQDDPSGKRIKSNGSGHSEVYHDLPDDNAPTCPPPDAPPDDYAPAETRKPLIEQFKPVSLALIPREITPYLIADVKPARALTITYGKPGTHKTNLEIDGALAVASGKPFLVTQPPDLAAGRAVIQCPVLWVDVDSGEDVLLERFAAFGRAYGVDLRALPFHFVTFPEPPINAANNLRELEAAITHYAAQLVIVDNLLRVAGVPDENSPLMDRAMAAFRGAVSRTGATITLIHHPRKAGIVKEDNGGDDLRGHSSILAAVDLAMRVRRDDDVITVDCTKARRNRPESFAAQYQFTHQPDGVTLDESRFFSSPLPSELRQTEAETKCRAAILAALETRPTSKNALYTIVRGARKLFDATIADLVMSKTITMTEGPRKSNVFTLA